MRNDKASILIGGWQSIKSQWVSREQHDRDGTDNGNHHYRNMRKPTAVSQGEDDIEDGNLRNGGAKPL
jgi:hypothetical protein